MVENRGTSLNMKLFYLLVFFSFGSLFPLLGVYFKDTGLSGTEIGTLLSISPVVMIFAQPLWGMITDYTQRPRGILACSLLLTSLLGFAVMYLNDYVWLILLLIVFSFFQSAIVPVSDSILLNYVHRTGKEYGNYRLYGAIGFAVSVLIVGKLSEAAGLQAIFFSFSGALLLTLFLVRAMPRENQRLQGNLRSGIKQLAKMPPFMLFLLSVFLVFGPIFANNFYFGFYIQEIGGTLTGVGIAFLLSAGSEAPFMKFAGGAFRKWGIMPIMMFASFLSAARWTFYFFEPSLAVVMATTVVQGFSVGLFIPAAMEYLRNHTPSEARATAVALYTAIGNGVGSWFCTIIGGMLIDSYSIFATYLFFGIMSIAGFLILLVLHKMPQQKAAPSTIIVSK
ncbi:MFS transporter [Fictibacillus iocasae]|uniref:MFS transporter n=1 Tax=Fictibacillus iocasae TaxID=2715437 RepID=A0ABW2NUS9_9BACL